MKNKKGVAAVALALIGAIGVGITAVMTAKATPAAVKAVEAAEKKKGEELTKAETVMAAAPVYAPAVGAGITTVACIIGSTIVSYKAQASLVGAYACLDRLHKDYRGKVRELFGDAADQQVMASISPEETKRVVLTAECLCENCCLSDEEPGAKVLFYDTLTERYFESTVEQVICAEYHLNRNYALGGNVSVLEWLEFLGLEPEEGDVDAAKADSEVWNVEDNEGLYWIDFNHRKVRMDDGLECYIIETPFGPNADMYELSAVKNQDYNYAVNK